MNEISHHPHITKLFITYIRTIKTNTSIEIKTKQKD